MDVRGRDHIARLPKTITITSDEIRQALQEPVQAIVDAAKLTPKNTHPEPPADTPARGGVRGRGPGCRGPARKKKRHTRAHAGLEKAKKKGLASPAGTLQSLRASLSAR